MRELNELIQVKHQAQSKNLNVSLFNKLRCGRLVILCLGLMAVFGPCTVLSCFVQFLSPFSPRAVLLISLQAVHCDVWAVHLFVYMCS